MVYLGEVVQHGRLNINGPGQDSEGPIGDKRIGLIVESVAHVAEQLEQVIVVNPFPGVAIPHRETIDRRIPIHILQWYEAILDLGLGQVYKLVDVRNILAQGQRIKKTTQTVETVCRGPIKVLVAPSGLELQHKTCQLLVKRAKTHLTKSVELAEDIRIDVQCVDYLRTSGRSYLQRQNGFRTQNTLSWSCLPVCDSVGLLAPGSSHVPFRIYELI